MGSLPCPVFGSGIGDLQRGPWALEPIKTEYYWQCRSVQALTNVHHSLIQKSSAFSKEFVAEATKVLVIRFIPLHPKDLNAWLADPEEWMNVEDKDNDLWEYELRVRFLFSSTDDDFLILCRSLALNVSS